MTEKNKRIYKRSKYKGISFEGTSWCYVATVGVKPNGKPDQKRKRGFKTEKEAKRALDLLMAQVHTNSYVKSSDKQYSELLEEWLKVKKRNVQESTFNSYVYNINRYVLPQIGHIKLSSLSAKHIIDFYDHLYEIVQLSGSTVQRVHVNIKDSLKYAVKMGYLAANPADLVDRPKRDEVETEVWTVEEAKAFLNSSRRDPLYIVYHLALMTGMRQGEILGLRWQDVDFEKQALTIKQVMCCKTKKPKAGAKTKAGKRTVGIGADTIEELKIHMERQKNGKDLAGDGYQYQGLIACTSFGTPIDSDNLRRSFDREIKRAGVKRIRFHDLRHTHATFCLSENVHPKVVADRLGHANIKITLDIYSHVLPSMQNEAVEKINKLIFD